MQKNNKSFVRALLKFLKSKADSKPIYEGITLLGIDKDEPNYGFNIKFGDNEYTLLIYDSHYNNNNASFLKLIDLNRPQKKKSLIQYTIDNGNFIIDNNEFILKQNKIITIGTKQEGLKEESEKLMLDLGFNTDKIIFKGEFNNPDFEKITGDLFKWLRIRAVAKLRLEEKYRNIETEEDVEIVSNSKLTGTIWKLGCNWGTGKPSFYNYIKNEEIIIGVSDKTYSIGDLIIVTEGHLVKAIAKIIESPISVTEESSLETSFLKHEIEYESWVNFSNAEWYELDDDDKFNYQLQKGICKVQNSDIRNKVIELWNNRNSNYWIFQGNPKTFDFETAIRNNSLEDWTVSAHKEKIKVGDKVILWISGKNSGCYSLAEITSEPHIILNSRNSHLWKNEDKSSLKAGMRITHNLIDNPLLWNQIKGTSGLENLKIGNQGTNFTATKKEFKIILSLINNITVSNNIDDMQAKNIILYGPPGTGKTYNSIDKAVKLASPERYNLNDHKLNKAVFDELRKNGQIEFVTFHQNYSYEDFVVGISPDVTSGTLRFDKRDGIFKQLAERAKQNWLEVSDKKEISIDFNFVFNSFFSKLIEEEVNEVEIPMKSKGYKYKVTSIDIDEGRIKFKKQSGGTGHDLLIKNLKAIYEGRLDYGVDGLGVYYYPLVELLKEFANTLEPRKSEVAELKRFVLIIDEINRANISKVFGELITLLEEDKRLGEENELRITLPNGEKDFGVPPNLYIIGTMNTADKSIALIDIALRRRFEFIGYYPIYDLLNDEVSLLLKKVNEAVFKEKKSADYLIGHAYFLKGQAIEVVLQNKVVPLLMEYFSGKTEIVSKIFTETNWNVTYDTANFNWDISRR